VSYHEEVSLQTDHLRLPGEAQLPEDPEPAARASGGEREPIFVVQMHQAATCTGLSPGDRGTLKSWAVPKALRRPGAEAPGGTHEDHPLEYAALRGHSEGNYGAGAVLLWTWDLPQRRARHGQDFSMERLPARHISSGWRGRS